MTQDTKDKDKDKGKKEGGAPILEALGDIVVQVVEAVVEGICKP